MYSEYVYRLGKYVNSYNQDSDFAVRLIRK